MAALTSNGSVMAAAVARDAEGHVLGNFHAYYSFNPAHERLRFMDAGTTLALRKALLSPSTEGNAASAATVIDIGCNEGESLLARERQRDLTVGLYRALAGTPTPTEGHGDDQETVDVLRFDETSASALNEKMQKEKRRVKYVFTDEGGSSHRKHFAVELRVDGQLVGKGEGVSKKVAKAKAAGAALRSFAAAEEKQCSGDKDGKEDERSQATSDSLTDAQSSETDALAARRSLFALGVDIDAVLITRAKKKTTELASGDAVEFLNVDVMTAAFNKQVGAFLERAKRPPMAPRKFDLVTCFSVTMWIHLNHGDEGLWRFLETVSGMAEHLLIEPQPWKCYRNALKRLGRLGVAVPTSFRELKVRADVVDKMDAFLLAAGRFRVKADLGKTNWSRPVVLYSRRAIPGIAYAER